MAGIKPGPFFNLLSILNLQISIPIMPFFPFSAFYQFSILNLQFSIFNYVLIPTTQLKVPSIYLWTTLIIILYLGSWCRYKCLPHMQVEKEALIHQEPWRQTLLPWSLRVRIQFYASLIDQFHGLPPCSIPSTPEEWHSIAHRVSSVVCESNPL